MIDDIPHAVLSEELEARIQGRRLVAGVFLTFEFDPGFFEQEILPVLLEVPLSHARSIRLVQLEDALRACAGRVAVYYDADHLVSGDAGSGRLDVERIPVRHRTGCFHPKNVLLLLEDSEPDENGKRAFSLLVGTLSANLTRSGWWENVEAAHFEEIGEGESTRLKEDLQDLLRSLRQRTAEGLEHTAAGEINLFLKQTGQRVKRVSQGSFQPHFHSGQESVPDFLERCAGGLLRDTCLEVLSPFFDETGTCAPLEELIRRFSPKETRVLLPRTRTGDVGCSRAIYEAVCRLPNVVWGQLPASRLSQGPGGGGQDRFVHAKLYRFFTPRPKREFCLVGSANLTRAAHQRGGNWESGLLVEAECPRSPEFWLEPVEKVRAAFHHQEEDEPEQAVGTPLMVRYYWDRNVAEAYWEASALSPALRLTSRGVELGQLEPLKPGQWRRLDGTWADRLAAMLKETSFLEVHGHGERPGLLLVQEEGMSHKPSLLLQLSVADILRYWAMLTPAQRAAFLETRISTSDFDGDGAALLARFKLSMTGESFFDRFAGYFHSFNCLEREVREHLDAGSEKEATYRLFGRKYDSLGTLLKQANSDAGLEDDVHRYIILLCAHQLSREVARGFPKYWQARRDDVRELTKELDRRGEVRNRLAAKDAGMPAFLDWFDGWFLRRARPSESES